MAIQEPGLRLAIAAVVAASAFVAGLAVDSFQLRIVAKPWPALALMAWVVMGARGAYARRIAAALVLCAVADVLLEFRETLFVYGIAVFLAAQLTLASAFTMHARGGALAKEVAVAVPFVAWLVLAFRTVSPGLGDLRMAVVAYMTAIGLMMWRAGAWLAGASSGAGEGAGAAAPAHGKSEAAAARLALAGAVVFGVSDTTIALDRFDAPIDGARYFIILTYWAALAMIAASAVRLEPRGGR